MEKQPIQNNTSTQLEAEMLPVNPPPIATRLLAWLLIVIFAIVFFVSVFVPLPETIRCRFVLVSETGSDPVQSRIFAVLHGENNIKEGESVKKGDVLFELRSDEIRSWRTQLRTAEEDLRAVVERRPKAEESYEKQRKILQSILTNVKRDIDYHQNHLQNREKLAIRMRQLHDEKVISEEELETSELNVQLSSRNRDLSLQEMAQRQLEIQQLDTDRSRIRTAEDAEESKLNERIAALTEQLENCEGDLMLIHAPYDAVVINVPNRNAGSVVDEGDELCQLAREESGILARLFLVDESLPKLETNQPVRLFLDAYPYQRYGTAIGTLQWVNPAIVETSQGPRFIAQSTIETNKMRLPKLRSGPTLNPFKVGMSGEARINVGKRTLIEFAFEPLKRLRENAETFPDESKVGP